MLPMGRSQGYAGAVRVKLIKDFHREFFIADHVEPVMQRSSDPDLERRGTAAFIWLSGFM